MFSGKHNRGGAEDCVDARREHAKLLFAVLHGEIDVGPFAAPNPITLTLEHLLGPTGFNLLNIRDQLLSVFRDAQKPLLQVSLYYDSAAAPANPTGRLSTQKYSLSLRNALPRRQRC